MKKVKHQSKLLYLYLMSMSCWGGTHQLFPSIHIFDSFYISSKDPDWNSTQQQWMKTHVDMASTNPNVKDSGVSRSLPYFNWPDMDARSGNQFNMYSALVQEVVQQGEDVDRFHLHFLNDVPITLQANQCLMEDRLYRVYRYDAQKQTFKDVTPNAYGDVDIHQARPYVNDFEVCPKADDALYIGEPWKFDRIALNIKTGPSSAWHGLWEYWNGQTWTALNRVEDTTANFSKSGRITFGFPQGWMMTALASNQLYWVRLRCTSTGSAPVLETRVDFYSQYQFSGISALHGEKFPVTAYGQVVVPGWDARNDTNGDGYIDNTEFAHRINPKASARFAWQSHIPAGYFTGRWAMNMASPSYRRFAVSYTQKILAAHPEASGVFLDNMNTFMNDLRKNEHSNVYVEYPNDSTYQALGRDLLAVRAQFVADIKAAFPHQIIMINWAGMPIRDELDSPPPADIHDYPQMSVMASADAVLHESALKWGTALTESKSSLTTYSQLLHAYCQEGKEAVIMADTSSSPPSIDEERNQLWALTRYYLTSEPCTYFDYEYGSNYQHPWKQWFDGMAYDIGSAHGPWFQVHSSASSGQPRVINTVSNSASENVYGRWFDHALVLNKSRWHADRSTPSDRESQVTIELPDHFFPMNPDGHFDTAVKQVTLSDFQGMILAKHCGDGPCGFSASH